MSQVKNTSVLSSNETAVTAKPLPAEPLTSQLNSNINNLKFKSQKSKIKKNKKKNKNQNQNPPRLLDERRSEVEKTDDEYENVRSEDDESVGSLKDFIIDDDDEVDEVDATKVNELKQEIKPPLDGINTANIIEGKRPRRSTQRYVDPQYWELMTQDMADDEIKEFIKEVTHEEKVTEQKNLPSSATTHVDESHEITESESEADPVSDADEEEEEEEEDDEEDDDEDATEEEEEEEDEDEDATEEEEEDEDEDATEEEEEDEDEDATEEEEDDDDDDAS